MDEERLELFERAVLPHLGAAYNLARWLTRNGPDAEDLVQDSVVRALTFFDGFHGMDGRAWLLAIVRNSFYTRFRKVQEREHDEPFDEEVHGTGLGAPDPETQLETRLEIEALERILEELPAEFREVIVLREIEGLSYGEIAEIVRSPVGTVMSRLFRARGLIRRGLSRRGGKGA